MRCAHGLLLAAALAPAAAHAFTLEGELGYGQRSETLKIRIDDAEPVVLALDAKRPRASVALAVTGDEHRYRIEGESIGKDGSRRKLAGAGLIVTQARMDRIAEAPTTAADALAEYRRLIAVLGDVAPRERTVGLDPGQPVPATAADVAAAEKRLGLKLPADYVRFITTVGALRFRHDTYDAAVVYGPQDVLTLADFVVRESRGNGTNEQQLAEMRARAVARYPRSGRDVVLDLFESSDATVLVRDAKCPAGEIPINLPESQWELIGADFGDNPFAALIDYEDDIVGETQCFDYDRLFAYSLHDQLIDYGDGVVYLRDDGDDARATVARVGEGDDAAWVRLTDVCAE